MGCGASKPDAQLTAAKMDGVPPESKVNGDGSAAAQPVSDEKPATMSKAKTQPVLGTHEPDPTAKPRRASLKPPSGKYGHDQCVDPANMKLAPAPRRGSLKPPSEKFGGEDAASGAYVELEEKMKQRQAERGGKEIVVAEGRVLNLRMQATSGQQKMPSGNARVLRLTIRAGTDRSGHSNPPSDGGSFAIKSSVSDVLDSTFSDSISAAAAAEAAAPS